MKKDKLIIVSGGMDSVTLLHYQANFIKMALSFYYGQKHKKELSYASENCVKLQIPWFSIDISSIVPFMKSSLLITGEDIPDGHYEDEVMKKTVVPFRNGIMLSIATGIAESNDCKSILIGNHSGDHAIYPDCRDEFIHPMRQAILRGTYSNIRLESPYVELTKRQIAQIGKEINVDYSLTWSCYKGGEYHCGACGTCVERKEALEGFDPTIYKEKI